MMQLTDDQQAIVETAHALADAARMAILPYFRTQNLAVEAKPGDVFDPVTLADKAAERVMRDILSERRPQDGVLGEEYAQTLGTSGLTWVLDPIDGTRGFMSGTPTWGVLIALSDETGPLYGVIDQPYIAERFEGGFGRAELTGPREGMTLATRTTQDLSEAILFSTFPEIGTDPERQAFQAVAAKTKLTRYGTDCYAYGLLAAGQIDLVIEAGLHPYDIHAPIAVVQAAGGVVTNWEGGPAHLGGQVIAAANAEIHAQAFTLLKDAKG